MCPERLFVEWRTPTDKLGTSLTKLKPKSNDLGLEPDESGMALTKFAVVSTKFGLVRRTAGIGQNVAGFAQVRGHD